MAVAKQQKKKDKWVNRVLLLVAVILLGLGWYVSRLWKEQNASFVHYAAFGIDIPGGYNIHGIDVSKHQDIISWPTVGKMQVENIKIGFAFIKATEGLGNVDKQFRRNWKEVGKAGIPRGAYHFFLATKSGKAQALNFINTVQLQPGDLPPVLDIEQLYGAKPEAMRKEVKAWMQAVEAAYGVKPIIYSYVDFYEKYLGDDFKAYPLWIAHYLQQEKPRIGRDWIFWQFSEQGNVDGITSKVDFNVFNGDSTAFNGLLIK